MLISSSSAVDIREDEIELLRSDDWSGAVGISNRPRPLDPSAIVRLSLSFLMCIATCFLRFAAVFVSFWQNPQTLSHFAIDRTPVVFHGGCRCPLLQVVLPNVPCSDIVRRARLRTGVCWRREEVIERAKGRCTWRSIRREDATIALDIILSLSPLIHTKKKREIR